MIKRNYYKIVRIFPDPSSYFYIKNETMNECEIQIFPFNREWLNELNLEYSFDKINWTRVTYDSQYHIYIPADGYMYFRNTSGSLVTENSNSLFSLFGDISIGGDIRTLFNYTDVESVTKIPDYGFNHPFNMFNDAKISDISNLSFRGITEIGNYGLYDAFNSGNPTITKGVDLRDVTIIGESALGQLYQNCHNLKEAYAPNVSTWDTSKTMFWLYDVASTGVLYKPSTLTIPTDDYNGAGLPSGWTTQDYPIK